MGAASARTCSPIVDGFIGGWQSGASTPTRAASRSASATSSSPGTSTTSRSDNAERSQRWFNTDAGFNKVSAQQLASNVRTFPLRLDNVRTDAVNNVDLSIIKNTTPVARQVAAVPVRGDQRAEPPAVPSGRQQPESDELVVRAGRHLGAEQLCAPCADHAEVPVLIGGLGGGVRAPSTHPARTGASHAVCPPVCSSGAASGLESLPHAAAPPGARLGHSRDPRADRRRWDGRGLPRPRHALAATSPSRTSRPPWPAIRMRWPVSSARR